MSRSHGSRTRFSFHLFSSWEVGAAYQKKAGSWLAGVEYVIVDDLDLELVIRDHHLTNTFPGEKHVTVYGEYWIGNLGLRGGSTQISTFDEQYWRLGFGKTFLY